ncbi:TlpA disulfide reductase family protein [Chitinophaga sancti]|uniref:Thiol-disulfide isomerase or thioredoxin n=1 Tax=Chitinophaga sancti TaxID=1004 RepID=A0A1K1SYQ8_9BACT|nr:TlpA disulfide reductase family protein [Chitinophaga sancti]WQD62312.1 TlpA disulfide reductase family protein [Chitinophaga sancti]WQG92119.1 TlpA disulfide reductase family protein [Chitinophaga sancti]SFW89466.1 Thiol-disulfide isomerase or thioredoxin [Chitinophaga sancti]
MKKIIFLLLMISSTCWAQQLAKKNKYGIDEFMLIEKVEDQEKKYNEVLKEPAGSLEPTTLNDLRAELAYRWLANGNVERYKFYKATKPKFSYRQALYLSYAVEKLFDEKQQYEDAAQISGELLNDAGTERTCVLLEVNAAANARMGRVDVAKKQMARSDADKGSADRLIKYFKDSQSNYLNRLAIVKLAAGEHQQAYDILVKAFREAESNPYMVATFKEAFKKVKGTESGFDDELQSLKMEAYQKYYKEVEKSYLASAQQTLDGFIPDPNDARKKLTTFRATKPVHGLTMNNLEGKTVNLGDQKGKILALDFWTTLCTPCVAAFTGFEKVVADHRKDEFQLFVVNLFEEDQAVKAFASQKPVRLEILRDEENKMYDVRATPTKIVFDPMGNIRFFATGYAGSTDREYYKLKAMVEIIKAHS